MYFKIRKKLVATDCRRERIYKRTGKPSVTFCEKEERRSVWLIFVQTKIGTKHSPFRRGGDAEIWTLAPVWADLLHFECGPFDHLGTSPDMLNAQIFYEQKTSKYRIVWVFARKTAR